MTWSLRVTHSFNPFSIFEPFYSKEFWQIDAFLERLEVRKRLIVPVCPAQSKFTPVVSA